MLERMALKGVWSEVQRLGNATKKQSAEWVLKKRRSGA